MRCICSLVGTDLALRRAIRFILSFYSGDPLALKPHRRSATQAGPSPSLRRQPSLAEAPANKGCVCGFEDVDN
jgi:hypothetical protein